MAKSSIKIKLSQWLVDSKDLYQDLYIELDAILRGIDRFFNVENLPFDFDDISDINYRHELIMIRDSILRVLSILEVVIPDSKKNAYWFGKFAESKFLSDQKRDYVRGQRSDEESPEKSIFVLYDSFINLKGILSDILKAKRISYLSFKHLGDIICKEIRENDYLNPFKSNINPDYDIIENAEISHVVKNIKDRKLRRCISMSFIFLFRQLRYLNCIDITTKRTISLSCGLLILILLRSEIRQLIKFFERELKKDHLDELDSIFKSLSFQFSMELKRVYNQELKNILQSKNIHNLRGRIENSHGILKNLFEQSVIQIAEQFNSSIKGENIFSIFTTKLGQSMKLRGDIYILLKMLLGFKENFRDKAERGSLYKSLKNYMLYFESFTFKLLRYDDYEEFSRFFNDFLSTKNLHFLSVQETKTFSDKVHNFIIFLETTMNHINNRTELIGNPIDVEKAEQLFNQYIQ